MINYPIQQFQHLLTWNLLNGKMLIICYILYQLIDPLLYRAINCCESRQNLQLQNSEIQF